jgi:hypothetical protein
MCFEVERAAAAQQRRRTLVTKQSMISFIFLAACLVAHTLGIEYTNVKSFGRDDFTLSWNIVARSTFQFRLKGKTTGWLGFGISPKGMMVGSDILLAGVDSAGNKLHTDRFAEQRILPTLDTAVGGTNDWSVSSISVEGAFTIVEGSRALKGNDQWDVDIVSGPTKIVWALSSSDVAAPTFHNVGFAVENIELVRFCLVFSASRWLGAFYFFVSF